MLALFLLTSSDILLVRTCSAPKIGASEVSQHVTGPILTLSGSFPRPVGGRATRPSQ